MIKRQQRIERICDVEKEYLAARSALDLLAESIRSDPNFGRRWGWSAGDASSCGANLEATYVIRLYAEFESGLRDIWRNYYKKRRRTPMEGLLQLMARQLVPQDCVDEAQEARAFRNSLVHEDSDEVVVELSLREVKSRLCRYFSYQPMDW
jgi:hypothetical protein